MADYWMKLYIEILDDPKMATLPDRLWRRIIELFLVAKRLNKEGRLPDTRQIAWLLRMSADDLESDMAQIVTTGIVVKEVNGWFILNFSKRQSAVPDAERQQQRRKRVQTNEYNENVTNESRNVTQRTENRIQINREQNTETEAEATDNDPFDVLQRVIESKGIMPAGEADIKSITELVKIGATPDDLRAGFDWKAENNGGKAIRYVSQIIGPTKTAIAKRLQAGGGPAKEFEGSADGRVRL